MWELDLWRFEDVLRCGDVETGFVKFWRFKMWILYMWRYGNLKDMEMWRC